MNEVYPSHDALLAAVLATTAEIAEKSPLAIFGTDMAEAFSAKADQRKPAFANNPATRREI